MSHPPLANEWISIASFIPAEVDSKAVEQALAMVGVNVRTEGSRALQILVAPTDAPRAVEALKRCPFASHIHFYPNE